MLRGALRTQKCSEFFSYLPQYAGNQLRRKDWRGCFVRSVHLFGSVSLEAASAQGMLPMFWTGYCGGYSWWASVTRFHSQGSSPDDLGSPSTWILAGFPESLVPPFPNFPIHKVNWKSCNYGALERAESCAELSSSQQVGSVFSPQKTDSFPLLSRPIILAVYERISLSPSLPPPNTHITQPETFYYPYFGTRSACSSILGPFSIFLLYQLTVTSETCASCAFGLQKTHIFYAYRQFHTERTINGNLTLGLGD